MKLTLDLTQDECDLLKAALLKCLKNEPNPEYQYGLVRVFGKVEAGESTSRAGAAVASPTKGDDAT